MYALCVSGAVNTQGFVWKFFYALYINFHSFIQSKNVTNAHRKNPSVVAKSSRVQMHKKSQTHL